MWKIIKRTLLVLLLLPVFLLIWGKFFNPLITVTQFNALLEFGKLDRNYISYDEMGTNLKKAVLASEDQAFYDHNGFDMDAIQKAIEHNNEGGKLQGGSTISQQTAKNIFLWQGRSWLRKGLEVPFTYAIEKVWGKKTILERYLNSIEMGKGVFGAEAAAQYYFGVPAKELTKSQAAWIAAVLPNPKKYDPKNPSAYLSRKHSWIMRQMNNIIVKDDE